MIELLKRCKKVMEFTDTVELDSTLFYDIDQKISELSKESEFCDVDDVLEYCGERIKDCKIVKADFNGDTAVQETMWHRINELNDLIDFIDSKDGTRNNQADRWVI